MVTFSFASRAAAVVGKNLVDRGGTKHHNGSSVMPLKSPSGQFAPCAGQKDACGDVLPPQNASETTVAQRMAEQMAGKGLEAEAEEAAHWFLDCMLFKGLVGGAVLLNTIIMGIEADHPEWETAWMVTENIFTVIFLLEAVLKLIVTKRKYFNDRWNWLDFGLVTVSVLDTWVLVGVGVDLQSLSILRIFRLFRLVRVLRLVKRVRKFVLVINGIIDAMTATLYVSGVMVLTIYVAAVFLVGFLGGDKGADYPGYEDNLAEIEAETFMTNFNPHVLFGSVSASMLTLFNVAILSEWPEVVRPLMIRQPHLVLFFIAFIAFVTFGVMNVIIAMIVENVVSNAKIFEAQEKADNLKTKLQTLDQIQSIWQQLTPDGADSVDIATLDACVHDQASGLLQLMKKVDLPRGFSARELLHMLDDTGNGELDQNELVEGFYRLVDSGPFQSICLVQKGINQLKFQVGESQKSIERKVGELLQSVESRMIRLEATIAPQSAEGRKFVPSAPSAIDPSCTTTEQLASQTPTEACRACVAFSEALRACAMRGMEVPSGQTPEIEILSALSLLAAPKQPPPESMSKDASWVSEGVVVAGSAGYACFAGSAGSGESTGSRCSAHKKALEPMLGGPILVTFDQRLYDMGLRLQWNSGAPTGTAASSGLAVHAKLTL